MWAQRRAENARGKTLPTTVAGVSAPDSLRCPEHLENPEETRLTGERGSIRKYSETLRGKRKIQTEIPSTSRGIGGR